jgi:hypothetical protein
MTTFNLTIDWDNATFGDPFDENAAITELAHILRELADRIEQGNPSEPVRDTNGNRIGQYTLIYGTTIKAWDLQLGDIVDLKGDQFADPDGNPLFQSEYVTVESIEHETPNRVVIEFEDVGSFEFPPEHEIRVIERRKE